MIMTGETGEGTQPAGGSPPPDEKHQVIKDPASYLPNQLTVVGIELLNLTSLPCVYSVSCPASVLFFSGLSKIHLLDL